MAEVPLAALPSIRVLRQLVGKTARRSKKIKEKTQPGVDPLNSTETHVEVRQRDCASGCQQRDEPSDDEFEQALHARALNQSAE